MTILQINGGSESTAVRATDSATNLKHDVSMASSYKESLMQNSTIIPSESDEIIEEEDIIIEEGKVVRGEMDGVISIGSSDNQQQAEESSFGPWMVVERRQRKHVIKQVNSSKSLSNQATKQREFTATPKSTKPISLRKPPVVIFSDFPILTRSQTKPNNSNHPPLDQLKHSTVVVDENLDPNILLIPSSPPSFPMTGLAPPTGEPPDKQVQPTHVLAPHTPIGTNLQSNQIDEISDPSGSTQVVAMLE
ncbi:hypothetical protein V6N12_002209 [Hibiscus sabdariffa]|uniref:Uncharacterized protein n=1 Tax=Hibiscus sabdariffa TaxID=183260 RepID=A0ABR2BHY6_9ROSI